MAISVVEERSSQEATYVNAITGLQMERKREKNPF